MLSPLFSCTGSQTPPNTIRSATETRLLFHTLVHGENIQISKNGTVAKRTNSFCKGIVFSAKKVEVNQKVIRTSQLMRF